MRDQGRPGSPPTGLRRGWKTGVPTDRSSSGGWKPAVNAAVLLDRGQVLLEQHKHLLPFYDVFDEQRYFEPATPRQLTVLDGIPLAITICEDAWNDKYFWPRRLYAVDPIDELMRRGSPRFDDHLRLILNISGLALKRWQADLRRKCSPPLPVATPTHVAMVKPGRRQRLSSSMAPRWPLMDRRVIAQAASFTEDLVFVDPRPGAPVPAPALR